MSPPTFQRLTSHKCQSNLVTVPPNGKGHCVMEMWVGHRKTEFLPCVLVFAFGVLLKYPLLGISLWHGSVMLVVLIIVTIFIVAMRYQS